MQITCALRAVLTPLTRAHLPTPALSACCWFMAWAVTGQEMPTVPRHGLSVREGTVLLEGKPFRGVGANYFSLFSRVLSHPDDTSSLSNLSALAKANIPFVRFMCGGFWPSEQRLYLGDPRAFFERLDRVVRHAEQAHVGLIPSLFWYVSTVPDLAGEPMQELGNPESKSVALIRRYTQDVVGRYKDSPAIWGWELGNEWALDGDLPNASDHRPPVVPELGTPKGRGPRDELTSAQLQVAYVAFAQTVRKLDPSRIIVSGNAIPRDSAWHNTREKSWKQDTVEQFGEILRRDNPDPMDAICVHIYASRGLKYPAGAANVSEIVGLTVKEARRAGKPVFLGEFGAERKLGSLAEQKAVFAQFLAAIREHQVPLAAFWVYDFSSMDDDWNVSFQNDRSFMLEMASKANERLPDWKQ